MIYWIKHYYTHLFTVGLLRTLRYHVSQMFVAMEPLIEGKNEYKMQSKCSIYNTYYYYE